MRRFSILLLAVLFPSGLMAQISFDKDLEELEQRLEEDLAEAVNPIYQSYIKALEELQRKASRAGDVETAAAITKALRNLPASVLTGKRHPKNTEEVKEFLHGTKWDIAGDRSFGEVTGTYTFHRDGTFETNKGKTGRYHVKGTNILKLWNYDPTTLNADFNQFVAKGHHGTYYGRLRPE